MWMKPAADCPRLGRFALFAAVAAVLLGATCSLFTRTHKPATPLISGRDTGWTRAPARFKAYNADGSPLAGIDVWQWGDSTTSYGQPSHVYDEPGTYIVTCQVWTQQQGWPFEPKPVGSDPSAPCTLHVVQDTMVFPDTAIQTIPVGLGYHWGCMLPDGGHMYVTNADDASVSVIDTRTNLVTTIIPVGSGPRCCLASNSGEYVYVTDSAANMVSVIRTSDNVVERGIPVPAGPGRLAISPDDSLLYVTHPNGNLLSVVHTDGDSVIQVSVGGKPRGIAVSPDGARIYVTRSASDSVTVLRASDLSPSASLLVGGGPDDIVLAPDGESCYVCCGTSHSVAVTSTTANQRTDTTVLYLIYPVMPTTPMNLAMLPGGRCLYVASYSGCGSGNTVTILRMADRYTLRTIKVAGANLPVPTPDGGRVYVPALAGVIVLGPRP
jgi:YVTN family beta-propeller protein